MSCGCRSAGECPHVIFDDTEPRDGVYRKYTFTRTDGSSDPGAKHYRCEYFVLDLTHDEIARTAALLYAAACEDRMPDLAHDIRANVRRAQEAIR